MDQGPDPMGLRSDHHWGADRAQADPAGPRPGLPGLPACEGRPVNGLTIGDEVKLLLQRVHAGAVTELFSQYFEDGQRIR